MEETLGRSNMYGIRAPEVNETVRAQMIVVIVQSPSCVRLCYPMDCSTR